MNPDEWEARLLRAQRVIRAEDAVALVNDGVLTIEELRGLLGLEYSHPIDLSPVLVVDRGQRPKWEADNWSRIWPMMTYGMPSLEDMRNQFTRDLAVGIAVPPDLIKLEPPRRIMTDSLLEEINREP